LFLEAIKTHLSIRKMLLQKFTRFAYANDLGTVFRVR